MKWTNTCMFILVIGCSAARGLARQIGSLLDVGVLCNAKRSSQEMSSQQWRQRLLLA